MKKKTYIFHTEQLFRIASYTVKDIFNILETRKDGLYKNEVNDRRKKYGDNVVNRKTSENWYKMLLRSFCNPFIGILCFLAIISVIVSSFQKQPFSGEWSTIAIVVTMIILSVILRFTLEWKSSKASKALHKMIDNTVSVIRKENRIFTEISISKLVPGDIIFVSAGDMIPADVRITNAKDLFVTQSALTGESDAIEKTAEQHPNYRKYGSVVELNNICLMGSTVLSGCARGIVIATGENTYLGAVAEKIKKKPATVFDKGIYKISILLIRLMAIIFPIVFLLNGVTKGDWVQALLFAVSVAIGLTPELLPMIITSNLAKGALKMAKQQTIVKNLSAIQSFGAMDILCMDKTGTLTKDQIELEHYLNINGVEDKRVLRHAYFNSFFQTGLKNLIDKAILKHGVEIGFQEIEKTYKKIDEIPFDFNRRRMSVIIEDTNHKKQIITKGAIEEILDVCLFVEQDGIPLMITKKMRSELLGKARELNKKGMRVLGVAQKSWISKTHAFSTTDESEMVLIGYLAFLDPPKESSIHAIRALQEYGVNVKVLTGDNELITKTICDKVGIQTENILTGTETDRMSDDELKERVYSTNIFAKMSPMQKARVVSILQGEKHTVGYLGDGINDSATLHQADIGISVDTAVDVAKEAADIILLKKDLMVLEKGIIEGRKTFGNISKYIKMSTSSNFGNIFSVLIAGVFLPFLPMLPLQLLIQNLLYDLSQLTIPFDNIDKEFLKKPQKWNPKDLKNFILHIGPISSIFDISIFVILWFLFGYTSPDKQSLFQSGWFVESLLSQTIIVHVIRTSEVPFLKSRASWSVIIGTILIIFVGIILPFSSVGAVIGMTSLPLNYFLWLFILLSLYCASIQYVKKYYIRKFGKWL